jgi:protein-L-isoaspartate(D-aspartate) O-methyltransferase
VIADRRRQQLVLSLRERGISDDRVLQAMAAVPRELFLPESFAFRSYDDDALPIGLGQTISQPLIVAKMTQELAVTAKHKVLEIGTGSGYQAAILAMLAGTVFTIERHRPLLRTAKLRFAQLGITNIAARFGDGMLGWPGGEPFDRIIITAAGGVEPPPVLLEQLAVGGVLVAPLTHGEGAQAGQQRLVRIRRLRTGYEWEEMWPVRFVPLLPGEAKAEPAPEGSA